MPFASHSNQTAGGFEQPYSQAGMMQIISPEMPNAVPTTIAPSGSWNSGLIFSDGYRYLTVAANLSQAGTVVVTQYIDQAGTIARPATTTTLTATTLAISDISDLKPFVTYAVQVNNSATLAATLTTFMVLMSAG